MFTDMDCCEGRGEDAGCSVVLKHVGHLRAMRAFGEFRTAAAGPGRSISTASGAVASCRAASTVANACCPDVHTLTVASAGAELGLVFSGATAFMRPACKPTCED